MIVESNSVPAFTELSDFASSTAGSSVVFATDDFFAPCENMLNESQPVFIADKYTEYGKWMDGWETRRKRIPGHDWCILKLAIKCVIRGLLVDTGFFIGNFAPKYSIQAARLTPYEEALLPRRDALMGSEASECDMERIKQLKSEEWEEIVPITTLRPGYEESRKNYQKVLSGKEWTYIRVNIYPDGGIARLRIYGEAKPELPPGDQLVDLASMLSGTTCLGYSTPAQYGHPRNIIKPNKGVSMADGWTTARRLDRPEVLEVRDDGTLIVTGEEWAVFKLGIGGRIKEICVDTTHFKGNYPYSIKVEGALLDKDWSESKPTIWYNILEPSQLSPNKEHLFFTNSDYVSHVRVTMAPDGGISRIRMFGHVEPTIL